MHTSVKSIIFVSSLTTKITAMKIQNTNQTRIDAIAHYNASFILENVFAGMTIQEACIAQYEGTKSELFDDENYDAPYEYHQFVDAHKEAVMALLCESPTSLWRYAQAHEDAYKSDYTSENEIGEEVTVRVIDIDGEYYDIIVGRDNEDDVFYDGVKAS